MRACFLGQNICALGYGVAMVQTLPAEEEPKPRGASDPEPGLKDITPLPNPMFAALRRLPHFA